MRLTQETDEWMDEPTLWKSWKNLLAEKEREREREREKKNNNLNRSPRLDSQVLKWRPGIETARNWSGIQDANLIFDMV